MADNITQYIAIEGDRNIVVGKGDVIINPPPPAEIRTRADLRILVKNVETSWIKGVLEKSVHHAVLLDLGKELRVEAVDHPWGMVLGCPDEPNEPLPAETKISNIFDETRLLLILGEPGAGKTITLLELARDLIKRVQADPDFTQPIPVVFNLSTWTDRQQPIHNWVIEELRSKYQTPRRLGRSWLGQRRILPLLDGLDEVKPENRTACVKAINKFSVDYGLQGLVVCSRSEDYAALPVRFEFYGAIFIRPLTSDQVDQYLHGFKGELDGLRATLQEDKALQILTQSPLMLNIMSLAYQGFTTKDLTSQTLDTVEKRRKHLFDTYVERMFKRKGDRDRPYNNSQAKQWLAWLAQRMLQHNQTIFMIEQLQPSWLSSRRWRWMYTFASRLIAGLLLGLMLGYILGLGVTQALVFGLMAGISIAFLDAIRLERSIRPVAIKKSCRFWGSAVNVVTVGVVTGFLFGIIQGEVINGLISGLIFGLILGLRGSWQNLRNDIQTVEVLTWSWKKALKGFLFGFSAGVVSFLIFGLSRGIMLFGEIGFAGLVLGVVDGFYFGLNIGLILGPIGAMFGGLSSRIVETKTTPNQGIQWSFRNALRAGLIFGPITGLIFGLPSGLVNGPVIGLSEGVRFGLSAGFCAMLWYGGLDTIQHYTLTRLLTIQGHIPGDYPRFLNEAVGCIFLQKVGSGYGFIHRLLLEHFAALWDDKK